MAGISDIFNIARSGIRANQQGLATTSHNIANINTKGYSRQEVVLETARRLKARLEPESGLPLFVSPSMISWKTS